MFFQRFDISNRNLSHIYSEVFSSHESLSVLECVIIAQCDPCFTCLSVIVVVKLIVWISIIVRSILKKNVV